MSFRWSPRPGQSHRTPSARRRKSDRRSSVLAALFETLETRALLTGATPVVHPTFVLWHPDGSPPGNYQSPSPIGYDPNQVRKAYGNDSVTVGGITGDGSGQTIAIVDAFDLPNALADLQAFDKQFGLPDPPSFKKVNENGLPGPLPPADSPGGWGVEEALDIEWAHSSAPLANIILVEANDPGSLLPKAVATAAGLPGVSVVSMSFGSGEFGGETALDSTFTTPNGHTPVTFLASTGDNGAPGGYPAYSPNVIAIGGTSLFLNPDNSYKSEVGWSGSGGGISQFEAQPSFQTGLPFAKRTIPDVSAIADPATGVAVYDTYDFGAATPWDAIGGTSLACPFWAGIIAITDQERVANGDSLLDGPSQTLPLLYGLPQADFHDITSGNNGFAAGPGYDLVTGRGTPVVPSLVRDLAPVSILVVVTPLPNAVEGSPLTDIQVAQFKDLAGNQPASSYIATINWGDGTPSTTGVVNDLGTGFYEVRSSHTYTDEGSFLATIKIASGSGTTVTATDPITVTDAPLSPAPQTVNMVEGTKYTNLVVGGFNDDNPFANPGDFSATIDWGDGKTTAGSVSSLGSGQFTVSGTKLYTEEGIYPVNVTVKDVGGQTTTILSTAQVDDAALTPIAKALNAVVGSAFANATVASFVDTGGADPVTDYSVVVDWGDGTQSTTATGAVSIVFRGNRFDVMAGHTYQHFGSGTYPVTVTISDEPNPLVVTASTVASSTVTLTDAALNALPQPFNVTEGQTYNSLVATFSSANIFAAASDFATPTINWGDGSAPTFGTITALGGGRFGVAGSHAYAEEGTYFAQVGVKSLGGASTQAFSTATVVDAGISVSAAPITTVAGQGVAATVASFTDGYALGQLSEFTATISWGDGTSDLGTITQPGGVGTTFFVSGAHAYAKPQIYALSISVSEPGGAAASDSTTAAVADAPFSVVSQTLQSITEGGSYAGAVGTFSTPNLIASAGDYVASVDWGDGSTTGGLVTTLGSQLVGGTLQQVFNVASATPHTYAEEGTYPVTLTVVSVGGTKESDSTDVTVLDAPISGVASAPVSLQAGTNFSGVVGSFVEYSAAPLGDFTATVDWGDGVLAPASVSMGPNGTFLVSATHLFTTPGTPTVSVHVSDVGGSTGTFTPGFTITDVPISATATPVAAVKNVPFSGQVATFTQINPFGSAAQFVAKINWGDGVTTTGAVTGSNGSYTVTGTHTFANATTSQPVTVSITHFVNGTPFATATVATTAHVLQSAAGRLNPASDNGVANNDGVTSIRTPAFLGTAEPGSVIKVYVAPSSSPTSVVLAGTTTTNSAGTWSLQIGPLGDGSYVVTAGMFDPGTGLSAQTVRLATGAFGGPLVIATTGPTVGGVSIDAAHGLLNVSFHTSAASIAPKGLMNAANYQLAMPVGLNGLTPLTPTGITSAKGANGLLVVTVHYGHALPAGAYVVTLSATGLTDLAGNMLRETKLVAFPQATNSPNPNYIAEIDVASNGVNSAPKVFVSKAEQLAAAQYAQFAQSHKVVRVPQSRPR
jgi:hypothetical protein